MKIVECDQGSHLWFDARCGRVTASEVFKVMSFLKSGPSKGAETQARADYKAVLVAEILTGNFQENFVSDDMAWGTATEPEARRAYALKNGVFVDTPGFVIHPTIERAGASPDGTIDPDGGLEIKCARTSTHLKWMLADEVPPEHEAQMAWGMACTGAAWWDFVSYDPRMPERLRLFQKRLYRDEKRIAELEVGVLQFLAEIDAMIARLNEIAPPGESLEQQLKASLNEDYLGDLGITDDLIRSVDPSWKGSAV